MFYTIHIPISENVLKLTVVVNDSRDSGVDVEFVVLE